MTDFRGVGFPDVCENDRSRLQVEQAEPHSVLAFCTISPEGDCSTVLLNAKQARELHARLGEWLNAGAEEDGELWTDLE